MAKATPSPQIEDMTPQNDGITRPSKETLLARKIARDAEHRVAAADYQRDQQATIDRMAKLKALRLGEGREQPLSKGGADRKAKLGHLSPKIGSM